MAFFSIFLINIVSGVLCSAVANEKGYNFIWWFILGLLFNFFALIAAAGLPDKKLRKYIRTLSSRMNQKISIIGQINTKSKNCLLDNRRISIKYLKYQGYSHIF